MIESWESETNKSKRNQRMGGWENIKQNKSKGSSKVFGTMEEIYSRIQFLEKEGGSRECKGDSSRAWEEVKCRSKKTRAVRYNREKSF